MIYRLKELKGDTIAVPQLVFSKLGIAEEYNVRVALYVLATGITDRTRSVRPQVAQPHQRRERPLLLGGRWPAGAVRRERCTGRGTQRPRTP